MLSLEMLAQSRREKPLSKLLSIKSFYNSLKFCSLLKDYSQSRTEKKRSQIFKTRLPLSASIEEVFTNKLTEGRAPLLYIEIGNL